MELRGAGETNLQSPCVSFLCSNSVASATQEVIEYRPRDSSASAILRFTAGVTGVIVKGVLNAPTQHVRPRAVGVGTIGALGVSKFAGGADCDACPSVFSGTCTTSVTCEVGSEEIPDVL